MRNKSADHARKLISGLTGLFVRNRQQDDELTENRKSICATNMQKIPTNRQFCATTINVGKKIDVYNHVMGTLVTCSVTRSTCNDMLAQ